MGHPQGATWAKSLEIKEALSLTTPTLQDAYCHLSRAATDPPLTRGQAGLCCPAFYFHSLPFPHSEHVAPNLLHRPTNDEDREVGGSVPAPAAGEGRVALARGRPRCTLGMLQPQAPASAPCLAGSRPHSLLMSPVAATAGLEDFWGTARELSTGSRWSRASPTQKFLCLGSVSVATIQHFILAHLPGFKESDMPGNENGASGQPFNLRITDTVPSNPTRSSERQNHEQGAV